MNKKGIRIYVNKLVHKGCLFYEDQMWFEQEFNNAQTIPTSLRNLNTNSQITVSEDEWEVDEWEEYGLLMFEDDRAVIMPNSLNRDLSYKIFHIGEAHNEQ